MSFLEWIEEARDTFQLDDSINAVLKFRPVKCEPKSKQIQAVIDSMRERGELPPKGKPITHYTVEWAPTSMAEVPNTNESIGVIRGRKNLYHD